VDEHAHGAVPSRLLMKIGRRQRGLLAAGARRGGEDDQGDQDENDASALRSAYGCRLV